MSIDTRQLNRDIYQLRKVSERHYLKTRKLYCGPDLNYCGDPVITKVLLAEIKESAHSVDINWTESPPGTGLWGCFVIDDNLEPCTFDAGEETLELTVAQVYKLWKGVKNAKSS